MLHDLTVHTHTLRPARQASFVSNLTPNGRNRWVHDRLRSIKRGLQLASR